MVVSLGLLEFVLKLVDLLGIVGIGGALLVNLAHALLLLSQAAETALEVLVAVLQLGLQLLDPVLKLFLAPVVSLGLLGLAGRLDKHGDAVGVAGLYRFLKQLALLL